MTCFCLTGYPAGFLHRISYFCLKITRAMSTDKTLNLEEMVARYGSLELQNPLSKEAFVALAKQYSDLAMEREPDGTVTIMSPVKKGSGKREFNLAGYFFLWHYKTKLGEFYSPSTGFDLPNGATKSPDVAWISPERLAGARPEDDEAFVKIVPDFIVEIRSGTDRLKKLQAKMTGAWLANGVRLAWLIDPYEEKVHIYRAGRDVEIVSGFAGKSLTGEAVLPGFELPLDAMRRGQ